jgi:diacylglycerol kinase family enzyme/membrane-associated phospholipid phosphatase
VQRRVRRLAPAPLARADLHLFRAVASTRIPLLGPLLPPLSRAANHSRLWLGIAATSAAFGGRFGRRAALRGVLAIGVTSAVTNLPAKLLTGRTRPDLALVPELRRLARVPASTSFPSGHSASAFAFATAASLEEPRLRLPLHALAAAVASSRVYTGVHYPGDVLVGSAIGIAVARASTRPWPLADRFPGTAEETSGVTSLVGPEGGGLVVVRNADAGHPLPLGYEEHLRDALPRTRIVEVEPDGDLVGTLARVATDAGVLGVSGGDGSVNAGAVAALEAGVPLAIVPSGTRNHFAKAVGLHEVDATILALETGRAIRMDVGEANGRIFLNAASFGAYPRFVAIRERLEGRIGKWPAAVWALLRTLGTEPPTELEIDGRPRRVWLLFVGNCHYETSGIVATHRRRLDDGRLDVRLVDADLPWSRTRFVGAVLAGRMARSAAYERWSAPELRLRAEQDLRCGLDGEVHDVGHEVVVRKRPRALLLMQPARRDGPS